MNLYGYCRTSTNNINGINNQKNEIIKFCKENNYNILEFFMDNGISGLKERKQLNIMINKILLDNSVDGIICRNLHRLYRLSEKLSVLFQLLRDFDKVIILTQWKPIIEKLNNLGYNFNSHSIVLKNNDTIEILNLMSVVAEYQKNIFEERMLSKKQEAIIAGKICHRPKKKIDMKKLEQYYFEEYRTNISELARVFQVSRTVIKDRIKEIKEKRRGK